MGHILLNEHEADAQVIKNLRRQIAHMKGTSHMSKFVIFKDPTDNTIKHATQYEVVDRKEIEEAIRDQTANLEALHQALQDYDAIAAQTENENATEGATEPTTEPTETPTEVTPVTPEAPAPVETTPAPVSPTPEQPATSTVDTSGAVSPAAALANDAPAQPAPITIQ